eukprot:CAMPEP_0179062126 /NCGR_PEP_ID=MMETSP0796-20121207/26771_1 /TAXON_ID=73915 /ORGANISM="Pyrodinium bahamense, Strain pbaha01" /LENGTH=244 /DNA_ID=CAMNT_0020759031 /DNA_START=105 /DNA_END=839 /DNA_ORIENTATION=+
MGSSQCKGCNDEEKQHAQVLPPPGEDFNAAKVSIICARGYDSAGSYCSCKIPGKAEGCRTEVARNAQWNFEGEVNNYKVGQPLLFEVRSEARSRLLLGQAQLSGSKIDANGFEGELALEKTQDGVQAFLQVRVGLTYVDPKKANSQPALGKPAVRVTFWKSSSNKEEIEFNFTRAPLGMSFDADRIPIVVNSINPSAEANELGVQVGMVIAKIDGVDLTEMPYDDAFGLMKEKVRPLPREEQQA